jgi:hypothetical protein
LKKIEMLFITFIYLSASFQNKQPNLQMSGSTVNTPIANTTVSAKSIIVERLCLVFGKSHGEVVQAIQSEMTAMEQEFQSWKLQLGERGDDNKKTESKPKKAAAKPRAKKADADVASSAVVTDGVEGAESAVDASASTAATESKPKKAPAKPRAKKADAPATAATESAVVEEGTTTEAAEPKAKKAPAKPRAKKADAAAPLNVSAEEAAVIAAEAAEPKAKKAPAKPRAKKAADASSESASPSTEEPKAKKNAAAKPRSKKAAEVVVPAPAAPVVEAEIDAKHEETTEDQFEEVEVEVVEFEFEGVQYLRGKADNKLYDPETSDVIGVWNEQSGQIDECSEEDDE